MFIFELLFKPGQGYKSSRRDAEAQRMTENEIGTIIAGVSIALHPELGPGLLESVYEIILIHELQQQGLFVRRQVPIPIEYHGIQFEEGFRADLIVEGKVIVELKSVEHVTAAPCLIRDVKPCAKTGARRWTINKIQRRVLSASLIYLAAVTMRSRVTAEIQALCRRPPLALTLQWRIHPLRLTTLIGNRDS